MNKVIAKQAHILRAHQKDEYITENLFNSLSDILYEILERNIWFQAQDSIKFISGLSYYSLTSLSNLQTLGEEYTGIVQIHSCKINLSKKLRLLSLILQIGGESAIIKCLSFIREYLKSNTRIVNQTRNELIELSFKLQRLLPFIYRINKSIFFIYGGYYYLSKRIALIKYIILKPWLSGQTPIQGYQILGIISLFYLIILFFNNSILRKEQIYSNKDHRKILANDCSKFNCSLCLQVADNSSLTYCGQSIAGNAFQIGYKPSPNVQFVGKILNLIILFF